MNHSDLIKKEKSFIEWLKVRNRKEEERILAHFSGSDLFHNLQKYSLRQLEVQWAMQEDEIKKKKPWEFIPYTADDWADWSIIDALKPDEIS